MPWIEALSDAQELRRCIRDLIALSALPAIWTTYDPQQIADSLAAALVSMLDADFVYIVLPGQRDQPVTEVTCTGDGSANSSVAIRWAVLEWLSKRSLEDTGEIPDPLGEGNVRIAYAPIGFAADAALIAGSRDADFPTEAQRLILRSGANQAAIAVDRWRAETDERRFAALVERSSDFIGFAGLEGVTQYINPAGLELLGLDGMAEAGRAHVLDFILPVEQTRARRGLADRDAGGALGGRAHRPPLQDRRGDPFPGRLVPDRRPAHRTADEHRHRQSGSHGPEAGGGRAASSVKS